MILYIITIITSLLIWGKISEDAKIERIHNSLLMLFVYGVLSFVIGYMFYKTYQVGTNENTIQISRFVGPINEKRDFVDSVGITIFHRMDHNNYKESIESEKYISCGGAQAYVTFRNEYMNSKFDSTRVAEILNLLGIFQASEIIPDTNLVYNVFKRFVENFRINQDYSNIIYDRVYNHVPLSKNEYTRLCNSLGYILGNYRGLYDILFFSSKEPSLLPWVTYDEKEWYLREHDKNYFVLEECIPFRYCIKNMRTVFHDSIVDKKKYAIYTGVWNSSVYHYFVGCANAIYKGKDGYRLGFSQLNKSSNHIDFLTASDMSQKMFEVNIHSELPLKYLIINYDLPINISNMYPSPDTVTMKTICFTSPSKLEYIRNNKIYFHAKLPTFENKQLLRSLILTTILTASVSLFCIQLFLLMKVLVLNTSRKLSEEDLQKYRKRLLISKYFKVIILVVPIVFIVVLFIRLVLDDPITINSTNLTKVGIWTLIVLVLMTISVLFIDKILFPKNKKHST